LRTFFIAELSSTLEGSSRWWFTTHDAINDVPKTSLRTFENGGKMWYRSWSNL